MTVSEKAPKTSIVEQDLPAELERRNQNPDVTAYNRVRLGVWEVVFADKDTPFGFSIQPLVAPLVQRYQDIRQAVPSCTRFFKEIYTIAPLTLLVMALIEIISATLPTALLYFDNKLFSSIETGLSNGKTDSRAIKIALAGRFFCQFTAMATDALRQRYTLKLRTACSTYFDEASIKVVLSKGCVGWDGSYEDESRGLSDLDPEDALMALRNVVSIIISTFGRVWFIYSLAQSSSIGPMFLSLSLLQLTPYFDEESWTLWARGCCWRAVDTSFLRLKGIRSLVEFSCYLPEIVSLNLDTYIVEQYNQAQKALAGRDTSDIWSLLSRQNPIKDTIISVANDWPTLYYAFGALQNSAPFQFSTVSSMSTASTALRWNLKYLFGAQHGSVTRAILDVKDMYERLELKVDPTSNGLKYPNDEMENERGMGIELKNITFRYKGSTSDKPAIRDLSCKIEPGELVVIVGANGSGKSSLVKLLTRLYAPTEGDILIDGHSIGDYRVRDIRRATALLSQDHYIFTLPLRENIGIGWVEDVENIEAIQEAAKKGGAHEFVSRRDEGYDTQLDPIYTKSYSSIQPTSKLYKEVYDKWEKSSSVSGGEGQRIIASRTFMRIQNGNTKLVVVDEPSSAMDPAGEFELFKNLREARNGKTMIFITHRFGHLTKHADRILCMKDGLLAETGTHAELIALKGQYHHLYNIQAQAFSTETETSEGFSPRSGTKELLATTPAS